MIGAHAAERGDSLALTIAASDSLVAQPWFFNAWANHYSNTQEFEWLKAGPNVSIPFVTAPHYVYRTPLKVYRQAGVRGPWHSPYAVTDNRYLESLLSSSMSCLPLQFYVWNDQLPPASGWANAPTWPHANYPYLALNGSWTQYQAWLSGRLKKMLRQARRTLASHGKLQYAVEKSADSRRAVDEFLQLRALVWQKKERLNKYAAAREQSYLHELARVAAATKALRVDRLLLNHATIAIHVGFVVNRVLYYYYPAYNPMYQHASPGIVLLYDIIRQSWQDENLQIIDFGPGDHPYKYRFTSTSHNASVITMCRSAWQAQSFRAVHMLESWIG